MVEVVVVEVAIVEVLKELLSELEEAVMVVKELFGVCEADPAATELVEEENMVDVAEPELPMDEEQVPLIPAK